MEDNFESTDFESTTHVAEPEASGAPRSSQSYRRLRRLVVLAAAAISLLPLTITMVINYVQFRDALQAEAVEPMARLTLNTKRSLELFLSERRSGLLFLAYDRPFVDLCGQASLTRVISNLNRSLEVGTFVDLGIIDDSGHQLCYSGPYELEGRNYLDQEWFHEVARRGTSTSDVFLGFRKSPHFAIATKHDHPDGGFYILRATIDAEMLSEQILTTGLQPTDDVFLINREGILQSPSRRYGEILTPIPLQVPHYSPSVEVVDLKDDRGKAIFMSSAYINNSPFVLIHIKPTEEAMGRWFTLRSELLGFLIFSAGVILTVILWGSGRLIMQIREADERRTALYHQMEYSNKLASIGRLAAGVAHEINNPLAIINEKAGLLKDLVTLTEAIPPRDKLLGIVNSVLNSVARCRAITHRLLGFARHMDVQSETIDLHALLKEVLDFLGSEAEYRNINVSFDVPEDLPTIESDRSQLQQVFLNILNNALAAVDNGGTIDITLESGEDHTVVVTVTDDGKGIPEADIKKIFEPFFTTKKGGGTGLGLSITYGIVKKLGGEIAVKSKLGAGTSFTVILPEGRKA
ncbi:ATP-binding protein [Acidobacteriota bacterium]